MNDGVAPNNINLSNPPLPRHTYRILLFIVIPIIILAVVIIVLLTNKYNTTTIISNNKKKVVYTANVPKISYWTQTNAPSVNLVGTTSVVYNGYI